MPEQQHPETQPPMPSAATPDGALPTTTALRMLGTDAGAGLCADGHCTLPSASSD